MGEFNHKYVLWEIDLVGVIKKKETIDLNELLVYSKECVSYMPLLDLKVRTSSAKDDISLNRKFCLTVLH
jgi:hypothetical protein